MNPYNPYAPPQAYPQQPMMQQPMMQQPIDVRVEGAALVVPNGAPLPDVCLKCGTRHGIERRRQRFVFIPMWARFFGPLLMAIFQKRSEFQLPLCHACHAQWKKWNLIAGVSWLPGFLIVILGIAVGDDVGGAIAGLGFLPMLVVPIVMLILRLKRIVAVSKIDGTHSWLTKIHGGALQVIMNPAGAMAPAMPQAYGYPQPPYPAR